MHSLLKMKRDKGFTIVELLIVIVVIGILATLVIVTFANMQERARDTERKTDINALESHLKVYYADKGNYPTLGDINTESWRQSNMEGLPADALQDPRGDSAQLTATVGANQYAYVVTDDDGNSCETDETTCSTFTLTAVLEGEDSNYEKSSN